MLDHKPNINKFCERLREVLVGDRSSINDRNDGLPLWTADNLKNIYEHITNKENLIKGNLSFNQKLLTQIEGLGKKDRKTKQYLALMIEVMSIYYAYPTNISTDTKTKNLQELYTSDLANTENLSEENFQTSLNAVKEGGCGSGGMGYNTNRYHEIIYLLKTFAIWLGELEKDKEKASLVNDNDLQGFGFQQFLDSELVSSGKRPQSRHLLLYFVHPQYYQPVISFGEKKRLIEVFKSFCEENDALLNECNKSNEPLFDTTDQAIKVISDKLKSINGDYHIYHEKIVPFWHAGGIESIPDLDIEALEYKKQIVLYGPPGTSKTYTAKLLAEEMIRYELAKKHGPEILEAAGQAMLDTALKHNIHRLQLHQAYTYEDFIGGLQFVDGNTVFEKGYLLNLIDQMRANKDLPHVLILDEINRVDLSRLFGECFSALENRGETIDLLSKINEVSVTLNIPENLYIIGTMNLIDHSVEQLDFALRRRFLWIEANYNAQALFEICKTKWENLNHWQQNKKYDWVKVAPDFERLVEAADSLNEAIEKVDELGSDFKLGHVFFVDAVQFLFQDLDGTKGNSAFLFTKNGELRDPVDKLWRLSLKPLLSDYLSGLDSQEKSRIMDGLRAAFKPNQ